MTDHVPAHIYARAAGDEIMLARLVKDWQAAQGSAKRRAAKLVEEMREPRPEPLVSIRSRNRGPWILTIEDLGRPPTTNDERKSSMSPGTMAKVRDLKRRWGDAVASAAKFAEVPSLARAFIVIQPYYDNNKVPDPDALGPAVKAIMDGLVKAEVLPDDRRAELPYGFHTLPPYSDGGLPRMTVTVYPLS